MADCCAEIKSELAVLRAEIARIPKVDVERIIKLAEERILPGVGLIATGIVVQKTQSLNAKIGSFEGTLNQMNNAVSEVRSTATSAKGIADKAKAATENLDTIARQAMRDAELSAGLSKQARAEVKQVGATASAAQVTATASETKAAKALIDSGNAVKDVGGLKGVVQGFGGKFNELVAKYEKIEKAAADAVFKAAKAVGISEQALLKVGAFAGRVLELAGAVANILTLIEQLGTLETLGARVDAVEKEAIAAGTDASKALGFIFQLKNQILGIDGKLPGIKDIADRALAGVSRVDFRLAGLGEQIASVRNVATTAFQKASGAEALARDGYTVAKGAVTTAQKAQATALLAQARAEVAESQANIAQRIGKQALGIGSKALEIGGTALTTALTALTIANLVKGLRGIPGPRGLQGLPGNNGLQGVQGLRGLQGFPGKDGVTMVVQLPGQKGDKGDPGKNGIGIPGRAGKDGTNGINGRDGIDVNPVDVAEIKNQLRIIRAQQSAHLAVSVNNSRKLGAQIAGGVSGAVTSVTQGLESFYEWSKLGRIMDVLTFILTLQNAYFLCDSLKIVTLQMISDGLAVIGIKDKDGGALNLNEIIGHEIEDLLKSILGAQTLEGMKTEWKALNRIFQAATNIMYAMQNMMFSVVNALNVLGSWSAQIGNALKKYGVVGFSAFPWMNIAPNFHNKFFTATFAATNVISQLDFVAQSILQGRQAIDDSSKQLDDLNTALHDATGATPPENKPVKDAVDASKSASSSPAPSFDDIESLQG